MNVLPFGNTQHFSFACPPQINMLDPSSPANRWVGACPPVAFALSIPHETPAGVNPHEYQVLYSSIAEAIEKSDYRLNLSACGFEAIHALPPELESALIRLLNNELACLILPRDIGKLPTWVFSLDRIKEVHIKFWGNQIDLRGWSCANDGFSPEIRLTAQYGTAVAKPPHLSVLCDGANPVTFVNDFVTDKDRERHNTVLEVLKTVAPEWHGHPAIQNIPVFVQADYYELGTSEYYVNPTSLVAFDEASIPRLADYMWRRHGANIEILRLPSGTPMDLNNGLALEALRGRISEERYAPGNLANGDHRVAFIAKREGVHWTPVIYFREKGQELLLIADSQGIDEANLKVEQALAHGWPQMDDCSPMHVVVIDETRQRDIPGCATDALVVSTAMTAESASGYELQDVINEIVPHAEKSKWGFLIAKTLPAAFFKTAQRTAFFDKVARADPTATVHITKEEKPEDLDTFIKRYTVPKVEVYITPGWPVEKPVRDFLRVKAHRLAFLVRVEWYQSALLGAFGDVWYEKDEAFDREMKAKFGKAPELK